MTLSYDPKQFLDLLQEYKSEETRRARRNLSAIAFVVISVRVVGLKFTDLKVFGADLSKLGELGILVLIAIVLAYWFVMFLLSWQQDREIQRERTRLLDTQIEPLRTRFAYLEKIREDKDSFPFHKGEWNQIKAQLEAYENQQNRTRRAARFRGLIGKLEIWVPVCLFTVAAGLLCWDIWALGKAAIVTTLN